MTYEQLYKELYVIFNDMINEFGEDAVKNIATWVDPGTPLPVNSNEVAQVTEKLAA